MLENVLILWWILGRFSEFKLDPKIDEKFLLGAMLVQDDPKYHFGLILGPILNPCWRILGSIFNQSGIDVEMIVATKPDRNF